MVVIAIMAIVSAFAFKVDFALAHSLPEISSED